MIWRVDVRARPGMRDVLGQSAAAALGEGGVRGLGRVSGSRVYLLESEETELRIREASGRLLPDPVVEECRFGPAGSPPTDPRGAVVLLIFKRPGVMDPVEASARKAFLDCGVKVSAVRTGVRYEVEGCGSAAALRTAAGKVLANEVVDEILVGDRPFERLSLGGACEFHRIEVPLRDASDSDLAALEKRLGLSLNPEEWGAIRDHFRAEGREPTDVELETIAQTWSEHCKHKTITGDFTFEGRTIRNLLKSTIMRATRELARPWCVSVFRDNAGIVEFDDGYNVCFKVETHNHPSAIEPYGGAGTGVGGVVRDVLGCGLGAKPIANTDVFCVGPPDLPADRVPPGSLPPARVLRGVVAGVRDYGNRMGIPTVNGTVRFDERYTANPVVYCGTVGILPKACSTKQVLSDDLVVVVGGRTGRDGIHGATFSSAALTHESESVSGGAVQIGNAIVEKRMLDTLLQARDRGLYRAVTDCGAGGLSSAVGEMGEECGAEVDLDLVPLKYEGLTYGEIWISEAQERMVLAAPPERAEELLAVFRSEDVEATVIGRFTDDGKLRLRYRETVVGELDMKFLHHGVPRVEKTGSVAPKVPAEPVRRETRSWNEAVLALLSSWNVCSKEWIVRQYDHEVQGGSVLKPLVGAADDGPGDAAVIRPLHGSHRGLAIGCGINPSYGDLDPHAMAASAIDEALRNVVSVGGDPGRTAILDNFSWGSVDDPESLGALVRACEACAETAIAYGTPFISGKDSLNNVYVADGKRRSIPHSLLISALSIVSDVRRCVSMDLKTPGNPVYLVGETKEELGGSEYFRWLGGGGGNPPDVDIARAPRIFRALHDSIQAGVVRACHDLSEGGLAVAAAEAAMAGEFGLRLDLYQVPTAGKRLDVAALLFSESNTRFLVEVGREESALFEAYFAGLPCAKVGTVLRERELLLTGGEGEVFVSLGLDRIREAWKRPLSW